MGRAGELMAAVGLGDRTTHLPGELSGGEPLDILMSRPAGAASLLAGQGDIQFSDDTTTRGLAGAADARMILHADLDNDGDLDLIVSHVDLDGSAVLLRNDCNNGNHWLGLTLEGKVGVAAAIGARVILHQGERSRVYINQWTNTYLSNSDPRLLMGLGRNGQVDRIEIEE